MKRAFTLAEVLITLTIIGVIAALTIPNLMKNYQNHANYAALKKTYSNLQNVYKLVEKDNGTYDNWGLDLTNSVSHADEFADLFLEHMKIQKDCSYQQHGCFSSLVNNEKAKSISGYDTFIETNQGFGYKSVRLSDGTNMSFQVRGGACFVSWDNCGRSIGTYKNVYPNNNITFAPIIITDVNGNKKPNQLGRDIFVFVITMKGLVPAGTDDTSYCRTDAPAASTALYGASCTYKALKEGGIYY